MGCGVSPQRIGSARDTTATGVSCFGLLVLVTTLGCAGARQPDPADPTSSSDCRLTREPTNLLQSPLPVAVGYGDVASDGQHVYFTGNRSLYRVPISGGPAETVYSGSFAHFYAVARGTVAWLMGAPENVTGLAVENAGGIYSVALPAGTTIAWAGPLVDAEGQVYFQVNVPGGGRSRTWRWNPIMDSAAEMPGVGMPDGGGGTLLFWADRGQVIWANNAPGSAGGIYATNITTGIARQLVGRPGDGFGSLLGLDASNVYGAGSFCPRYGPPPPFRPTTPVECPFRVSGVPRDGAGAPFIAYERNDARFEGFGGPPVADDSGLYWIDSDAKRIYHAPMSKGAHPQPVVELTSSLVPAQFALDACNLYWLDVDPTGAPRLMAVAKK
jgi:hypothetical protein